VQSAACLTALTGGYQPAYDKIEALLDAVLEAVSSSGLTPGQDVFVGLEMAAHEIFDYVSHLSCFASLPWTQFCCRVVLNFRMDILMRRISWLPRRSPSISFSLVFRPRNI